MLDLSIIIVSYNAKKLLVGCLQAVNQNSPKDKSYELILIDNASSDGSKEEILKIKRLASRRSGQMSNTQFIQNKENLGFAKAVNQGLKEAKGKFVLLLNSDAFVLEDALSNMIEFLESHPNVGVLGGKLLDEDGKDQPSTGPFLNVWQTTLWLLGFERLGILRSSPKITTKTDWVSGAMLMLRKELIEKIGLLDENFFMYIEEMEWCYRVKKAGFEIYFLPTAKAIHKKLGSGNRSMAVINIYRGLPYFFKKHASSIEYIIVKTLLTIKAYIAILIGTFTKNYYLTSTYKKALSL